MNRSERRLLVDTSILGIALTLLVTFLDFSGLLAAPERFFYDFRARRCQHYTPKPTTRLVHVDVDDTRLLVLRQCPWRRSKLTEIVDELRIGGAKTMALDVILSEPSPYELDQAAIRAATEPTSRATTKPTTAGDVKIATTQPVAAPADDVIVKELRLVDNDVALAKALDRFGRAVVPLSLSINAPPNKELIYLAMIDEMSIAPWTKEDGLLQKLIERGFKEPKAREAIAKNYTHARDEGMFQRIALDCRYQVLSVEELGRRILPRLDPQISESVPLRALREQYERFAAIQAVRKFTVKIPSQYPKLVDTREEHATLKVLSDAGWTTGFFDFVRPTDGTVRFIPLLANHHGYAYPQLGLSLACAMLDVPTKDLIVTKESITIPCKPNPIVIPVHSQETYRGTYDMFIDIPWFGPPVDSGWQRMYDWPNHEKTAQHIPVQFIWDACEARHRIASNNATADRAMVRLAKSLDEAKLMPKVNAAAQRDLSDPTSRLEAIDIVLQELKDAGWLRRMKSKPRLIIEDLVQRLDDGQWFRPMRLDLTDEEVDAIGAFRSLRMIQTHNKGLENDLKKRRRQILEAVEVKAALIGWTAGGCLRDVMPHD